LGDGIRFKTLKDLYKFKSEGIFEGIGDYSKKVDKVIIYLDGRGKVMEGEADENT
jgi:uncharacterized C2H2 Zn-finger protein